MRRVLIIAAAYAPLLAACATDAPRSPLVTTPAAFEAPSRGPALPAASLDRWWTLYNDAQLTALIEEALGSSFDARTAASRLEQARAVRQAALK
jgi:outer membrane protein, multidrug efflux system